MSIWTRETRTDSSDRRVLFGVPGFLGEKAKRKEDLMAKWNLAVDLKDVLHDRSFEQIRDEIADRIEHSGWRNITKYPLTLGSIITALRASQDPEDFYSVWNAACDLADTDRVWLATH